MPQETAKARERRAVKRETITLRAVEALQPGESLTDDKIAGFTCKRSKRTKRLQYGLRYSVGGKQRWHALGVAITPAKARELAEKRRGQVADGKDPTGERQAARRSSASTVNHVLDEHLKRYVRPELRSADEVERVYDQCIRPKIGAKSIYELRRRDVVELLDEIADRDAPVMADRCLAHLRAALNWWAARDDDFNSPIVKGMARTSPAERARKRVLNDQEIRDVWKALDAADAPDCFAPLVRFLLLSARRRSEAAGMQWQEVDGDVWVIPEERGEAQGHKGADRTGAMAIPLTPAMRALMGEPQKRGYVFSTTGGEKAFNGFGKAKAALDKAIAELRKADGREPMPAWTLHDLRRTGRSLMSRAGVDGGVAERVLGHVIPGVRGVYDRHEYLTEKRDALERLAKLIGLILAGEVTGNVVRPAQWATA